MNKAKTHWVHCNDCGHPTKHESAASVRIEAQGHFGVEGHTTHEILSCRGCECVTFWTRSWCIESAQMDPDDFGGSDSGYETTIYPAREHRPRPPWLEELPEDVFLVLAEMYTALDHGLRILSAMSARTAIDCLIRDAVGDKGSFKKGLGALSAEGFVTPAEQSLLETATDVGSAAAHRGYRPETADLDVVVEITERITAKHYITPQHLSSLAKRAGSVAGNVPPRDSKHRATDESQS